MGPDRVDLVCVLERLDLRTSTCDSLKLFDLQNPAAIGRLDVFAVALTVLLELLVHIVEELLDLLARELVLLVEARTDAKMQWFFRFLLLGSLLEAGAFTAETKLDNFAHLRHVLATLRNDALHVTALGPDQASSYLKLAFVWDLNVVSASVLYLAVNVVHVCTAAQVLVERLCSISRLEAVRITTAGIAMVILTHLHRVDASYSRVSRHEV